MALDLDDTLMRVENSSSISSHWRQVMQDIIARCREAEAKLVPDVHEFFTKASVIRNNAYEAAAKVADTFPHGRRLIAAAIRDLKEKT